MVKVQSNLTEMVFNSGGMGSGGQTAALKIFPERRQFLHHHGGRADGAVAL